MSWREIVDAVESAGVSPRSTRDHLVECARCARLAERAGRLLDLLSAVRLESPPEEAARRGIAAIREELARRDRLPQAEPGTGSAADGPAVERPSIRSLLERLLGTSLSSFREIRGSLVEDSLVASAALRGPAAAAPSRALLYETDELSVYLSLAPSRSGDRVEMLGQLAPRSGMSLPPGGRAFLRGEGGITEAPIDARGQFAFPERPADALDLTILLADSLTRLSLPGDGQEA